MNKNLTELVFILDRSGSMAGLEADTIGGFNSFIEKQKKEEGECLVSTVLFDHECNVLHDRASLGSLKPMTEAEYFVGGSTALLDAVGGAIHHIANIHKYAREEDRPAKTIFIITTDGMENASHRYSKRDIKRKIQLEQEKYGWEFIFLGANIDAVAEAESYGIRGSRAARFHNDSRGIKKNYEALGMLVSEMRCSDIGVAADDDSWADEIRKDYRSRK